MKPARVVPCLGGPCDGERIQAGEIDEATLEIERDGHTHSGKVIRSKSGEFVFSFQRTDEKRV